MAPTETTCARHPDTPTRLSCVQCGTPICPRCAVDAPVGQKCPDCARQVKAARRQGKPDQYAKATGYGIAAAAAGAAVLPFVLGVPFLGLILTGFVGYGVAHAVLIGSEGNRAEPFRNLAMGLAVGAVVAMFLLGGGLAAVLSFRGLLLLAAAAYGAYARFTR